MAFKPSILFMGRWQTVQNQMLQNAASDQVLHRLLTKKILNLNEIESNLNSKWIYNKDKGRKFNLAINLHFLSRTLVKSA